MDIFGLSGRAPRHAVLPHSGCDCIVEWITSRQLLPAELSDVSRHGLRLVLASELPEEVQIRVKLHQASRNFSLTLPATVRWCRRLDHDRWDHDRWGHDCWGHDCWGVGCHLDQELAWESMGELFLNGILCSDEIPSDPVLDGV